MSTNPSSLAAAVPNGRSGLVLRGSVPSEKPFDRIGGPSERGAEIAQDAGFVALLAGCFK